MVFKKEKEFQLQMECVKILTLYIKDVHYFSIPNEMHRGDYTIWNKHKKMGAVSGVADLLITTPTDFSDIRGVYIEFKSFKGKQSEKQILFQKNAIKDKYVYELCNSTKDFVHILEHYWGTKIRIMKI